MDAILRRLGEIDATLETPSDHYRGGLLAERDGLLDRLAELYLASTPRRRGAIRRFVAGHRRLIMALEDRVTWHAYRIRAPEDLAHLRLGLAAASIVGVGIDPRDLALRLSHLFGAAERAGIEPRAHFREVADLSGRRRSLLRSFS